MPTIRTRQTASTALLALSTAKNPRWLAAMLQQPVFVNETAAIREVLRELADDNAPCSDGALTQAWCRLMLALLAATDVEPVKLEK